MYHSAWRAMYQLPRTRRIAPHDDTTPAPSLCDCVRCDLSVVGISTHANR